MCTFFSGKESWTPPCMATAECLFFLGTEKLTAIHIILCVESSKDNLLKRDPSPSPLLPPRVKMEGLGPSDTAMLWRIFRRVRQKTEVKSEPFNPKPPLYVAYLSHWFWFPRAVESLPTNPLHYHDTSKCIGKSEQAAVETWLSALKSSLAVFRLLGSLKKCINIHIKCVTERLSLNISI